MKTTLFVQLKRTRMKMGIHFLLGLFLLFLGTLSFAQTVKITGMQEVTKSTTFKNVTLDLKNGGFNVKNNASLDIENAVVNVIISPSNPYFVFLTSGTLNIKNSIINVKSEDISPTPDVQSVYQLLRIQQGNANILNNEFSVDLFYTVGLLTTDDGFVTQGITFMNNKIKNFHGGLYLLSSNDAEVNNNFFTNVSFSNVFFKGLHANIKSNTFLFPGNLTVGSAIDLLQSSSIVVSGNTILSSSNYGIYTAACQNVLIDNNQISDSATYAIYMNVWDSELKDRYYLSQLKSKLKKKIAPMPNLNITISNNYFSQNRFGVSGMRIEGLAVRDNSFIQRFNTDAERSFWTNNNNVLIGVQQLVWDNNIYKEAFAQAVPGDNAKAYVFVPYPEAGGVVIN